MHTAIHLTFIANRFLRVFHLFNISFYMDFYAIQMNRSVVINLSDNINNTSIGYMIS